MSFLESNSLHSGGARVACRKPRDVASARVLSVKLRKDRGPADASKLMGSNGNAPPVSDRVVIAGLAGSTRKRVPEGRAYAMPRLRVADAMENPF